ASTWAQIQEPRGWRTIQPTFWYTKRRPGPTHRKNCPLLERTTAMVSLFDRLSKERPTLIKKTQELLPTERAQKLLNWLQHWTKPTITAQEIYTFGPRHIRNRKRTLDVAEILVRNGWLIPVKTRWRRRYEWQIVKRPVLYPNTTADTPLMPHEVPPSTDEICSPPRRSNYK